MIFVPDISFHPNIANFVIGTTRQCNFRCKYCCFSGKYSNMRTHSDKHMSRETMDQAINFIKTNVAENQTVFVSFYGGEALMQMEIIEYAVTQLLIIFDNRIEFDISTNGWMLNMPMVKRILQIPRAAISVSLDGIKDIHDKNRIHISGSPTFDKIVYNLKEFKKSYPEEYKKRIRILMTMGSLNDISQVDMEFNEVSKLLGERPMLVSHILPNFKENLLYRDSYKCKIKFFEQALAFEKNGTNNLHVHILNELRQKALPVIENEGNLNNMILHTCLNNLKSCFISTDGDLYACEKVNDKLKIGNIWQGFNKSKICNIIIKYCLRRNLLCHNCAYIYKCHRCLADLNFSFNEHQAMCSDYIENVKLSNTFVKKYETTI